MNNIWANRLIAGTKTWDECPDERKDAVKLVLQKRVKDGKTTAEKYTEITGEEYTAE